jgi:hypothetical protein
MIPIQRKMESTWSFIQMAYSKLRANTKVKNSMAIGNGFVKPE